MKNKYLFLTSVGTLALIIGATGCKGRRSGSQWDPNKTHITVATLDKGIGTAWLTNAAQEFMELYKDATQFEAGKTGVEVAIVGSTSYDGSYVQNQALNEDIYFTEGIPYRELSAQGKFYDMTETVNEKLTSFGESKSIMDKIDSTLADYLTVDGKVYGIPFYDSFYGLVYDMDLWNDEKLYLAKDGKFVNKSGDLSLGTDNQAGTLDDGLPATYEEFDKLMKKLLDKQIIPYLTSTPGIEYTANYLFNVFADYEGVENMKLTLTLNGTANDLVEENWDGTGDVPIQAPKAINNTNGYDLQRQVGRYKTLKFFNDVLVNNPDNYNKQSESSHIGAQQSFIEGKQVGKPVAMLIEGSWWENEAKSAFESYEKNYGTRSNYAIMPIPFENAEKAAACNYKHTALSLSQSFGIISQSSQNKPLALEFMKFLHTDKMLSKFTRDTSITRPLNYEISAEDKDQLTTYAKSLIDLKKTADVFYPYSTNQLQLDHNDVFGAFNWVWHTRIGGQDYRHPWMYFTTVDHPSPVTYFNGQHSYYKGIWSSLL